MQQLPTDLRLRILEMQSPQDRAIQALISKEVPGMVETLQQEEDKNCERDTQFGLPCLSPLYKQCQPSCFGRGCSKLISLILGLANRVPAAIVFPTDNNRERKVTIESVKIKSGSQMNLFRVRALWDIERDKVRYETVLYVPKTRADKKYDRHMISVLEGTGRRALDEARAEALKKHKKVVGNPTSPEEASRWFCEKIYTYAHGPTVSINFYVTPIDERDTADLTPVNLFVSSIQIAQGIGTHFHGTYYRVKGMYNLRRFRPPHRSKFLLYRETFGKPLKRT